jgi:hypothetical protein
MTYDTLLDLVLGATSVFATALRAMPNEERAAMVWEAIAHADIAFAAWDDPDKGSDFTLLKGEALLLGAAEPTRALSAIVSIPCRDMEHALALRGAVSEGRGPGPNLKVVALN